jgi:hypothetical protein
VERESLVAAEVGMRAGADVFGEAERIFLETAVVFEPFAAPAETEFVISLVLFFFLS